MTEELDVFPRECLTNHQSATIPFICLSHPSLEREGIWLLTNGRLRQAHNEKANKEGIFSRISGFLNKGFLYYFMNHS